MTEAPTLAGRVSAVVIGASAGGIEALMRMLPALPGRLSVPIFIVIHLPRERPSLLAPLFGARCAAPVREAEDKLPVEIGTIYFAPPDYHLLLDKGPSLALSADEPVNYSRPAIDILFESAIDVYGARLAAVVLTGANDDGAAGIAAVQRTGGIAIVQDPKTALFPAMPAAALKRIAANFVLPLDEIIALLLTIDGSTVTKVDA
ncbi:MAG: chemotaxis protein CheB [Burkholderiaceae bacterium]